MRSGRRRMTRKGARTHPHWYRRLFRTGEVPADLAAVTDIDSAAEVDPQAADLTPAAVDAIWEACQNLYRTGVYPLLSLCLRRRGKIVLNRSLGHARDGVVATVDTPICLFSASKSVSAVLVHLLAQQGRINLLDPVSYYIPGFAAKGKGGITLLQLLTHRGGIAAVPDDVELDLLYDHDAALRMICETEPTDHQGREQAYHALTTGFIFNELIRLTTGLNAQQYLNRYLRKPMGMRYFRYGLTAREQAAVAINTTTGLDSDLVNRALASILGAHPDKAVEMTNDPRFYGAVIPSANLFATAEEVSRFYQMLLQHGRWQDTQILDPLTVHRATHSQGAFALDKSLKLPMRYSAGFMLGGSPVGIYGRDTQYAYGHLGYANIFCWADPQRDIAVSLMNTGKLAVGPHLKALPLLLDAISTQCPPVVDREGDEPRYRGRGATSRG
ncbi:MAG: serine hydrolase domain-containing protein [Halioglobus sp.]